MTDKTQQIEARIDREVSGAIALRQSSGGALTIVPNNMGELFEFAKLMAVSGQCVRPIFRGNPGACLAIALQAFRTGADPFAVANKAYLVNDQIAYEAQYIHAVINTSGSLAKRLRPTYSGEGPTRCCKIVGVVIGEDDPLEYESPKISNIPIKNSPLWKADPDQQLFYYSARAWARRHLPEIILGMYVIEEIRESIDVTPPARPRREDFSNPGPAEGSDVASQELTSEECLPESEPQRFYGISRDGEEMNFADAGSAAQWLEQQLSDAPDDRLLAAVWEDHQQLLANLTAASYATAALIAHHGVCRSRLANRKQQRDPAPTSPAPERPAVPVSGPQLEQVKASPAPPQGAPKLFVGPPPIFGNRTDLRAWALAMYMPKARQATARQQLIDLWADSADHIEAFKRAHPAGYIPWKAEIDAVFEALPEGNS